MRRRSGIPKKDLERFLGPAQHGRETALQRKRFDSSVQHADGRHPAFFDSAHENRDRFRMEGGVDLLEDNGCQILRVGLVTDAAGK